MTGRRKVIGVDFDNTIVCYDALFHAISIEHGLLPADMPAGKDAVREHLRRTGREDKWTELQGIVYGARIRDAIPFPGALEFFMRAARSGLTVHIVSHKTRQAVAGLPYDLHQAARDWLAHQGFFDPDRIGLSPNRVHFCTTRNEKIEKIKALECALFIDDLEEVYREAAFPTDAERILFAPQGEASPPAGVKVLKSWQEISDYVFTGCN